MEKKTRFYTNMIIMKEMTALKEDFKNKKKFLQIPTLIRSHH